MTDFVGNELYVGDKVVYVRSVKNGKEMFVTEIVGFTNLMVKVKPVANSRSRKGYDLADPKNCILYNDRTERYERSNLWEATMSNNLASINNRLESKREDRDYVDEYYAAFCK